MMRTVVVALIACAVVFGGSPVDSGATPLQLATAPTLGQATSFAVLAGSTVTNTGPTRVNADLGISPGNALTGFPPGLVVGGTVHAADSVALGAQNDTTTAYTNLAGQACPAPQPSAELGGLTLVPGVYCFSAGAHLTGNLTLDAGGVGNSVWVFQIPNSSTLITSSNARVLLTNGAQACNVFWQVSSSATLGTGTVFAGTIIALASISLVTGASISGRLLARNGAVTLDSNTVGSGGCPTGAATPVPSSTPGPTSTAVPGATSLPSATPVPGGAGAGSAAATATPSPTPGPSGGSSSSRAPTATPTPTGLPATPVPTAATSTPAATLPPTPTSVPGAVQSVVPANAGQAAGAATTATAASTATPRPATPTVGAATLATATAVRAAAPTPGASTVAPRGGGIPSQTGLLLLAAGALVASGGLALGRARARFGRKATPTAPQPPD